jgi:acetyl-CoA C-acetyltransferase
MKNKYNEVVIAAAARTPIGIYRGSLKNIKADQLGSIVIKEVLKRSKIKSDDIDEVILGQVLTAGTGQNSARQASINAGLSKTIPAYLVNQVCGSGLRSVISGFQSIKLNDSKYVISGGQENMSIAPHALLYRDDNKLLEERLIDTMIYDGLIDAFNNYHMGVTAENIAEKFKISRDDQDNFALRSQKKTQLALEKNKFEDELVKVDVNANYLDRDEHPRKDLKVEDLKKLKPSFKKNGTVTPGNASGLNDGAAAVLLTSLEEAEKKNLKPFAKIVSWSSVGVEPSLMGLGPIDAVKLALKKANWKIDEVDLFEINEAFAAQSIAVIRELKIDELKVNVNGGAIALGHPIGASGTRILVTLIHEMQRQNKTKGCATLCIGGGMGIAVCIEKI